LAARIFARRPPWEVEFCAGAQTNPELWKPATATSPIPRPDARALQEATTSGAVSNLLLTSEAIRKAGALFKESYDPRHGGFGGAPKFPQPSQPQFLLRYAKRFKDEEAIRMVLHTCDRMAAGGIHDQLGGALRDMRSMPNGLCRILKRCSMTTRS